MATQNNLHVSDDLLAALEAKAADQGKTVDQLAEETLRKGLEDRDWQDLLAYGRERGRASGYTEEDVPRLVREWRQEQAGRLLPAFCGTSSGGTGTDLISHRSNSKKSPITKQLI